LRQQVWTAAIVAAFCVAGGCRREEKIQLEPTEEAPAALQSTVHAADPKSSIQLIKGFHGVEQNSWRWTMGRFAVTLRPPMGAAENGATVVLKFSIPDAVLQKTKAMTLSASVQNTQIGKKTYNSAGEYSFTADVPANLLKGEAATVDFSLDQFLPTGTVDARELGVVFVSAGLEPK
jgi:hypothetical protein